MIKNETWAPFIVATSGTKIKCNERGNETSLSEISILFMQPYCMSFTTPYCNDSASTNSKFSKTGSLVDM